MMALADQLLIVSDLFGAATARSRARVSTILFNDGKRLDRIARGFDIGTRSFEAAMSKLSADWPAGAPWPEDIYRPAAPRGGAPAPAGPEPTPTGGAGLSDLAGRSMVDAPDIPEGVVFDPALVERVTDRATS